MSAANKLVESFTEGGSFGAFARAVERGGTVGVERLAGSAFSVAAAGGLRRLGGVHVFVAADKDSAAYLAEDLWNLLGLSAERTEGEVLFFPTAYKRSIRFGQQDASGIVQRTGVLNAITSCELATQSFLAVCTYPEALVEKVVGREELGDKTLIIEKGERVAMSTVEQRLVEWSFTRVDFVFEPGQYSIRGGIMDIFSYSSPRPFRIDFFGDEVESIRVFEISSQLSARKVERMEVLPNLKSLRRQVSSFAAFVQNGCWWVDDLGYTLGKLDEFADAEGEVTSGKEFLHDTRGATMVLRASSEQRPAGETVVAQLIEAVRYWNFSLT